MPKLISFITPQAGRWYIVTRFKKEIEVFLYDPRDLSTKVISLDGKPRKFVGSLEILGWPYGQGKFNLRWTEKVDSEETAKTAKSPTDPSKKKYESYRKFYNSDMIIGTREEMVDYLELYEVHPGVVEVLSKDGGNLEIILMITYEVLDPIKTRAVKDFLGYGAGHLSSIFRHWASGKTFQEIRTIQTTDDPSDSDDFHDRLQEKNNTLFIPAGFKILNVAVEAIMVSERSKDLLESEESVAKEKNAERAAEHTRNAEILLNTAQEARNETEISYQTRLAEIKKGIIKATGDALAIQNEAWTKNEHNKITHLFVGGNQSSTKNEVFEATTQALGFSEDDRRKRPVVKRDSPDQNKEGGKK